MDNEPRTSIDALTVALRELSGAVVITDRAGNVRWCNEAFTRMTGFSLEEARDRCPSVRPFGVHTGRSCAAFWRSVLAGRIWEGEVLGSTRDGGQFPVRLSAIPLLDRFGRLARIVALHETPSPHPATADLRILLRALASRPQTSPAHPAPGPPCAEPA